MLSTKVMVIALLFACSNADDGRDPGPDPGVDDPLVVDPGETESFTKLRHTFDNGQVIDIYVPPEYDSVSSYPVLYFNDGENYRDIFNFLTFDYPEPFIMVGLHAGGSRNSKYIPYEDEWITRNWGSYTPKAAQYAQHLVDEVIPYVDEVVNVDENRRAIFGISLGGLNATWVALEYPDYFSFSAGISHSYWVGDHALLNESVEELTRSNRFYFDIGTREWNYYVPFINTLKDARLRYGREIYYYEVFGASHSSGDWAQRIDIPFKLFLNGGVNSRSVDYQLTVECIASQVTPGLFFQRLNPTARFDDGVIYSLTTEATYEIIDGNGEVTWDGRFEVSPGGTMTVEVTYEDWSVQVDLNNCL